MQDQNDVSTDMKPHRRCSQCQRELPEGAPGDRCPHCLLELALQEETTFDAAGRASAVVLPRHGEFGDYELLQEIARGGMGVVWKARQKSLNRVVALKLILSGEFASKEQVQRFHAEAQAAAGLRHPNIVAIYETGEHQGQHFFSMEYVRGRDLAEVAREQPLPAKRAARYGRIIAEAIEHAHRQGTLHRDLKPSNVLIDEDDQPRITDFGLAKRLGADAGLTVSGQIMGSPGFMPPEQAAGDQARLGPPTDVYGLGAILYHLLTARAPFQAATVAAVLKQVQEQEPVSPRLLNPSVPLDLDTICLKCLEKDPSKRYPTAQALADELDRFMRDEPIHARPIGSLAKVGRWCRRKPVVASLAAALLAAITLGSTATLWQLHRVAETARQLRARAYASEVNLAHRALAEKNIGRAVSLIQAQEPKAGEVDLRGFEWRYLAGQCRDGSIRSITAHDGDLHAIDLSPDGRFLATGAADHAVKLWDMPGLTPNKTIHVFPRQQFYYVAVSFSADSRMLAASDLDSTWVWEVPSGRLIQTLRGVKEPRFFPRSSTLATRGRDGFELWNTQTWTSEPLGLTNVVNFAWSQDEQWLAVMEQVQTNYVVRLFDSARVELGPLSGNLISLPGIHPPLVFSPDGQWVTSWNAHSQVFVWNRATRALLTNFQAQTPFMTLAFAPDSHLLATCGSGDHFVRLWSVPDFRLEAELYGHLAGVRGVTFTPDGKTLVSGSRDRTLKLWRRESPRSDDFAVNADTFIGFTSDSRQAVTLDLDATIKVWDLVSHELIQTRQFASDKRATAGVVSASGAVLALGYNDGSVELRDMADGSLKRVLHLGYVAVASLRLSADGRYLAGILWPCPGGLFSVWDTTTGLPLTHIAGEVGGAVSGIEFSHGGDLLAIGRHDDHSITLWDLKKRQRRHRLEGHRWVIDAFAFSPDDTVLASSSWDATVRLWDVHTGKACGRINGHGLAAEVGGFSPDGRTLAVAIKNGLTLWHVASEQEMATLEVLPPTWNIFRFSPDGNTLVVGASLPDRETRRLGPGVQFWRARTLDQLRGFSRVADSE